MLQTFGVQVAVRFSINSTSRHPGIVYQCGGCNNSRRQRNFSTLIMRQPARGKSRKDTNTLPGTTSILVLVRNRGPTNQSGKGGPSKPQTGFKCSNILGCQVGFRENPEITVGHVCRYVRRFVSQPRRVCNPQNEGIIRARILGLSDPHHTAKCKK